MMAIKEEDKHLRGMVISTSRLPPLQPIVSPSQSLHHDPGIPTIIPHHPPSEAVKSAYHIARRIRWFLVEKMLVPKDLAQQIALVCVDFIAARHRVGPL